MRLDKYLKVSRIIKRRTVANDACSTGHVCVNGNVAKPSTDIKVGDTIRIQFGSSVLEAEVLQTADFMPKEKTSEMYRIISNKSSD